MAGVRRRVLVVDDDPDIRACVAAILEEEGYEIIEASDGREALARLDDRPDLILLDLMMPVLDGQGFLRERPAGYANIPVVVFTASSAHPVDLPGVRTVLHKPSGLDRILAVAARELGG